MSAFCALPNDLLLQVLEKGETDRRVVAMATGMALVRKDWAAFVHTLLNNDPVWAGRAYKVAIGFVKFLQRAPMPSLCRLSPDVRDADLCHNGEAMAHVLRVHDIEGMARVKRVHELRPRDPYTAGAFASDAFRSISGIEGAREDTYTAETHCVLKSSEAIHTFVWALEGDMMRFLQRAALLLSTRLSQFAATVVQIVEPYDVPLALVDLRTAAKEVFEHPAACAGTWDPSWSRDEYDWTFAAYHLEMTRMPFDAHTRVVAMLCHRAGIPKFDKKCVRFIWGVLVCRAKRLLTRACLIATSGSHVGEAPLIYYNNTGSLQVRPDAQHAIKSTLDEPVYDDERLESASECSECSDEWEDARRERRARRRRKKRSIEDLPPPPPYTRAGALASASSDDEDEDEEDDDSYDDDDVSMTSHSDSDDDDDDEHRVEHHTRWEPAFDSGGKLDHYVITPTPECIRWAYEHYM